MKRAAVLIGVNKTGNLPVLNDAANGAHSMATWAHNQKIDIVRVLTDEHGPLRVRAIKDEIKLLVDGRSVEQLIIYFAGHGVNLLYNEYWLLSDAPQDSQEAVNVQGSVTLARHCGIPHVVLFSDACRTAPEGIQAQGIRGSEIFPNSPVGGPESPVDVFFASLLGKPAKEVRDPAKTAAVFKALYTGALTDALDGSRPAIVERFVDGTETVGLVRPRPLRDFLGPEMSARLKHLNLQLKVTQVPDARITSDPTAWVSRLPMAGIGGPPSPPPPPPRRVPPAVDLHTGSAAFLDAALGGRPPPAFDSLPRGTITDPELDDLRREAVHEANTFGPAHFETQCGFKIRGTRVERVVSTHAHCQLIEPGTLVRVDHVDGPAAAVLFVLPDQTGVTIPAIPGFVAGLTFHERELTGVSYEPSDNSDRWPEYERRHREIRMLRGVVAGAARRGLFRLETSGADELARRMQYSKSLDPSLALYAAYAYDDLRRLDLIRDMIGFQLGDLRTTFFDIAMLAHRLDGQQLAATAELTPPLPLLGQGWARIRAHQITLPGALEEVQRHLLPSLWTHLTPEGTELLENAIVNEEIW